MQMPSRKGYSFVELMVVIAIIAIMLSILFVVFGKVFKAVRPSETVSIQQHISQTTRIWTPENDG